ncbi:MAG: RNA-binding cell elongation regulator Jag/EloR [Clostridia bacterium]
MKTAESTGKNVATAIENGLKLLKLEQEQVDIEILSQGGFLKPAKVKLTKKLSEGENAQLFLEELLAKINFDFIVDLVENEEEIKLNLIGKDGGSVIGYRGEVLDSLQYLTSLMVNQGRKKYIRVVVDAENYRGKREDILAKLASNLEKKVIRTRHAVKLEPMNPFERRIIHATLQDSQFVETSSSGEEPNRHVIISPKGDNGFVKDEELTSPSRKKLTFAYRSDKKRKR